jgi:selenocysteine-specific elongation factor
MSDELIIGTAGHVDHGKSTLIKALTGTDTDRLKEEKERGISIELGFAHFKLPSGKRIGIVDVPGHERFLHNMVAGVGSMDLVLLVIAADEGVMPQTREHLDILQLLGVSQGIVVLTKCDLVDEDWLAMVEADVQEFLKGTALEESPVCRISGLTGAGLAELVSKIEEKAASLKPRSIAGAFRLPIDRVFTMQGFGTVVTGTLWSGIMQDGDTGVIEPGGLQARIRGIQVYGKKVSEARAGQRTAVNIAGVEYSDLERGQVLVKNGVLTAVRMINARLALLDNIEKELKNGVRIRFYTGTTESIGRVYLLDREEILPGETGLIQIRLEKPVAATHGDRFVLRLYSPMVTIGGGVVLEAGQQKCRRFDKKRLEFLAQKEKGQPEDLIYQVLATADGMLSAQEIHKQLPQFSDDQINSGLSRLVDREKVSKWLLENVEHYLDKEKHLGWLAKLQNYLASYHRQHPLRIGAHREEARQKIMEIVNQKQFQLLLEAWQRDGQISAEGLKLKLPSHMLVYEGPYRQWKEKIEREFCADLFSPPDINALISSKGKGKEALEVWESLVERGEIIRAAEGIFFHRRAIDKARAVLEEYFAKHERLTPADFRNLIDSSRKYSLPLLEYFDNTGLTKRHNEYRIQNAKNKR